MLAFILIATVVPEPLAAAELPDRAPDAKQTLSAAQTSPAGLIRNQNDIAVHQAFDSMIVARRSLVLPQSVTAADLQSSLMRTQGGTTSGRPFFKTTRGMVTLAAIAAAVVIVAVYAPNCGSPVSARCTP
jgi:hypothetical protein